ncbi:MAG: 6-bladed beta-propeller [Bacteroidales bacterium]|nr:6-bladed beta-propeller [Bacteroidales bacterium]
MKNLTSLIPVLLCLCTVSFSSCENKKQVNNANQEAAESREIPVVKIRPPDESDLKPLLLSEFADSISYVKMDTDPSYFISTRSASKTEEGYFFGQDMLHFSNEGKFICRVGQIGRGPGEYVAPVINRVVDRKNKIVYVKGYGTKDHMLLKYSLIDGKYVGTLNKNFFVGWMSIVGMDDVFLMVYNPRAKQNTEVKQDLILYNTTLDSVMDTKTFDRHITSTVYDDFKGIQIVTSYRDKLYYKDAFVDTLFAITKEKITPCLVVDLGKYACPVDVLYGGKDTYENVLTINNILIAGDRLFMQCSYYSTFGIFSQEMIRYFMYICDLNGKNGSYYEPIFTNDLDNGPNFSINIFKGVDVLEVGEVDGKRQDYYLPNNKMEKKMKDKDRFKRLYEASNPVEDNPIIRTIHWKE